MGLAVCLVERRAGKTPQGVDLVDLVDLGDLGDLMGGCLYVLLIHMLDKRCYCPRASLPRYVCCPEN